MYVFFTNNADEAEIAVHMDRKRTRAESSFFIGRFNVTLYFNNSSITLKREKGKEPCMMLNK